MSDELRFRFGRNWQQFLRHLDAERRAEAARSMRWSFGRDELSGTRLIDIGCGSGLFSSAAVALGADVVSFDYDRDSVDCTLALKALDGDPARWRVLQGSILDRAFTDSLGRFELVYSWGVLHHTGSMWEAIGNAADMVADGGTACIALYNDQGALSRFWHAVKRLYCSGTAGRVAVSAVFVPLFAAYAVLRGLVRHGNPMHEFRSYREKRGMHIVTDWIDWLGGYPFEAARPDDVRAWFEQRGFELVRETRTNGWGCNQYVFRKRPPA